MVEDNIASYRLTAKIVEGELLQIFPNTTSVALQIRVSARLLMWRSIFGGQNANIASGGRRCIHIPHPTKVDRCEWRLSSAPHDLCTDFGVGTEEADHEEEAAGSSRECLGEKVTVPQCSLDHVVALYMYSPESMTRRNDYSHYAMRALPAQTGLNVHL